MTYKEKGTLPKSLLMNKILNNSSAYLEFQNVWVSVPKEKRNIYVLTEQLRGLGDLESKLSTFAVTSENALI